jgi:Fe-S-cluster containining protein
MSAEATLTPSTTLPLAVVPSCEGCGACCNYAGAPPGYSKFYLWDPAELSPDAFSTFDGRNWQAMLDAPRAELFAYRDAVYAGESEDRAEMNMSCIWLDADTRQCRHYEWRPLICREFQRGSPGCLSMRECERIDGERAG